MPKHDEDEMDLEGKLTTAHKVSEERLAALWSAIDTADTKTNVILGFASIILILFAGFYSLGNQSLENKALPVICVLLFSIALVAYIVLLVLSILSYRIRDWSYRPDLKTLIENSKNEKYNKANIEAWVADECESAFSANLILLRNKSKKTNGVLYAFAVETVALASGLALP